MYFKDRGAAFDVRCSDVNLSIESPRSERENNLNRVWAKDAFSLVPAIVLKIVCIRWSYSLVSDPYLSKFCSIVALLNHFNSCVKDGRSHPLVEMRERISEHRRTYAEIKGKDSGPRIPSEDNWAEQ